MDSDELHIAQHFVEAERHVAEGERLVAHQRRVIDKRRRDGRHTELAMHLLAEMEKSLRSRIQERDRLRQRLSGDAHPRPLNKRTAASVQRI